MPRVVFDDLQQMFSGVKGFQDKKCGEGGRGMRTQPLLLKVCSLVYILTDGGARPVYRAAQRACLSPQTAADRAQVPSRCDHACLLQPPEVAHRPS